MLCIHEVHSRSLLASVIFECLRQNQTEVSCKIGGAPSRPHSIFAKAGVYQATLLQSTEIMYTRDSGRVYNSLSYIAVNVIL